MKSINQFLEGHTGTGKPNIPGRIESVLDWARSVAHRSGEIPQDGKGIFESSSARWVPSWAKVEQSGNPVPYADLLP